MSKDILIFGIQASPRLPRHDQDVRRHGVLGKRKVGSNGVMVGSYVRRPVILGSVVEAGRQCRLGAGLGKYDRFCAERLEHLDHEI